MFCIQSGKNEIYCEKLPLKTNKRQNNTYSQLIVPIKKDDWESKYKQKKQQKGSATAIPLDGLSQLLVSQLNIRCGLNCLLVCRKGKSMKTSIPHFPAQHAILMFLIFKMPTIATTLHHFWKRLLINFKKNKNYWKFRTDCQLTYLHKYFNIPRELHCHYQNSIKSSLEMLLVSYIMFILKIGKMLTEWNLVRFRTKRIY